MLHRGDSLMRETLTKQLERSVEKTAEDPRWMRVNDETPVLWEKRWTTWGALTMDESAECSFNDAGVLVGGFRI